MAYLNCPKCHLALGGRAAWRSTIYCPRCSRDGDGAVAMTASVLSRHQLADILRRRVARDGASNGSNSEDFHLKNGPDGQDGRTHLLQLFGTLDAPASSRLQERLALLAREQGAHVILDLSGLHDIDEAGIRSLVDLCRADPRLLVLRGPRRVQYAFALAGLDERLPYLD